LFKFSGDKYLKQPKISQSSNQNLKKLTFRKQTGVLELNSICQNTWNFFLEMKFLT